MEMARGEAVKTSSYILNHLPTYELNKTPHELWTGIKPHISHFPVFGCKAFVHVPNEKRLKLQPKSVPCIFIGYSENSKAYRFYNPNTQRLVISRDAIFIQENEETL